jgi:hypothetical protein
MGKNDKFKERKVASYKREFKGVETREGKREALIVLSFRNFDRNQGQSFEEWQAENLLALAISKLREVCQLTVGQAAAQQIIKPYTKVGFPPESGFTHPKHVLPDVIWCSMHIQGKECVIGYFEDNIFHVVFLDKDHEFWITKKRNT